MSAPGSPGAEPFSELEVLLRARRTFADASAIRMKCARRAKLGATRALSAGSRRPSGSTSRRKRSSAALRAGAGVRQPLCMHGQSGEPRSGSTSFGLGGSQS